MAARLLAVSLVVLVGCAAGVPADGSLTGDDQTVADLKSDDVEAPAAEQPEPTEAVAPEPMIAPEPIATPEPAPAAAAPEAPAKAEDEAPVCKHDLDLLSSEATYRGWTAAMHWDASAGPAWQLDALDLATIVWSVVETWRATPTYAADHEGAVREQLGHVDGIVVPQDFIDAALHTRHVPGFSDAALANCLDTTHGYLIAVRAADNPYPHAHEVTHALAAAIYGDADPGHKRAELWSAEGLAVNASKLFANLHISRTEAPVLPH